MRKFLAAPGEPEPGTQQSQVVVTRVSTTGISSKMSARARIASAKALLDATLNQPSGVVAAGGDTPVPDVPVPSRPNLAPPRVRERPRQDDYSAAAHYLNDFKSTPTAESTRPSAPRTGDSLLHTSTRQGQREQQVAVAERELRVDDRDIRAAQSVAHIAWVQQEAARVSTLAHTESSALAEVRESLLIKAGAVAELESEARRAAHAASIAIASREDDLRRQKDQLEERSRGIIAREASVQTSQLDVQRLQDAAMALHQKASHERDEATCIDVISRKRIADCQYFATALHDVLTDSVSVFRACQAGGVVLDAALPLLDSFLRGALPVVAALGNTYLASAGVEGKTASDGHFLLEDGAREYNLGFAASDGQTALPALVSLLQQLLLRIPDMGKQLDRLQNALTLISSTRTSIASFDEDVNEAAGSALRVEGATSTQPIAGSTLRLSSSTLVATSVSNHSAAALNGGIELVGVVVSQLQGMRDSVYTHAHRLRQELSRSVAASRDSHAVLVAREREIRDREIAIAEATQKAEALATDATGKMVAASMAEERVRLGQVALGLESARVEAILAREERLRVWADELLEAQRAVGEAEKVLLTRSIALSTAEASAVACNSAADAARDDALAVLKSSREQATAALSGLQGREAAVAEREAAVAAADMRQQQLSRSLSAQQKDAATQSTRLSLQARVLHESEATLAVERTTVAHLQAQCQAAQADAARAAASAEALRAGVAEREERLAQQEMELASREAAVRATVLFAEDQLAAARREAQDARSRVEEANDLELRIESMRAAHRSEAAEHESQLSQLTLAAEEARAQLFAAHDAASRARQQAADDTAAAAALQSAAEAQLRSAEARLAYAATVEVAVKKSQDALSVSAASDAAMHSRLIEGEQELEARSVALAADESRLHKLQHQVAASEAALRTATDILSGQVAECNAREERVTALMAQVQLRADAASAARDAADNLQLQLQRQRESFVLQSVALEQRAHALDAMHAELAATATDLKLQSAEMTKCKHDFDCDIEVQRRAVALREDALSSREASVDSAAAAAAASQANADKSTEAAHSLLADVERSREELLLQANALKEQGTELKAHEARLEQAHSELNAQRAAQKEAEVLLESKEADLQRRADAVSDARARAQHMGDTVRASIRRLEQEQQVADAASAAAQQKALLAASAARAAEQREIVVAAAEAALQYGQDQVRQREAQLTLQQRALEERAASLAVRDAEILDLQRSLQMQSADLQSHQNRESEREAGLIRRESDVQTAERRVLTSVDAVQARESAVAVAETNVAARALSLESDRLQLQKERTETIAAQLAVSAARTELQSIQAQANASSSSLFADVSIREKRLAELELAASQRELAIATSLQSARELEAAVSREKDDLVAASKEHSAAVASMKASLDQERDDMAARLATAQQHEANATQRVVECETRQQQLRALAADLEHREEVVAQLQRLLTERTDDLERRSVQEHDSLASRAQKLEVAMSEIRQAKAAAKLESDRSAAASRAVIAELALRQQQAEAAVANSERASTIAIASAAELQRRENAVAARESAVAAATVANQVESNRLQELQRVAAARADVVDATAAAASRARDDSERAMSSAIAQQVSNEAEARRLATVEAACKSERDAITCMMRDSREHLSVVEAQALEAMQRAAAAEAEVRSRAAQSAADNDRQAEALAGGLRDLQVQRMEAERGRQELSAAREHVSAAQAALADAVADIEGRNSSLRALERSLSSRETACKRLEQILAAQLEDARAKAIAVETRAESFDVQVRERDELQKVAASQLSADRTVLEQREQAVSEREKMQQAELARSAATAATERAVLDQREIELQAAIQHLRESEARMLSIQAEHDTDREARFLEIKALRDAVQARETRARALEDQLAARGAAQDEERLQLQRLSDIAREGTASATVAAIDRMHQQHFAQEQVLLQTMAHCVDDVQADISALQLISPDNSVTAVSWLQSNDALHSFAGGALRTVSHQLSQLTVQLLSAAPPPTTTAVQSFCALLRFALFAPPIGVLPALAEHFKKSLLAVKHEAHEFARAAEASALAGIARKEQEMQLHAEEALAQCRSECAAAASERESLATRRHTEEIQTVRAQMYELQTRLIGSAAAEANAITSDSSGQLRHVVSPRPPLRHDLNCSQQGLGHPPSLPVRHVALDMPPHVGNSSSRAAPSTISHLSSDLATIRSKAARIVSMVTDFFLSSATNAGPSSTRGRSESYEDLASTELQGHLSGLQAQIIAAEEALRAASLEATCDYSRVHTCVQLCRRSLSDVLVRSRQFLADSALSIEVLHVSRPTVDCAAVDGFVLPSIIPVLPAHSCTEVQTRSQPPENAPTVSHSNRATESARAAPRRTALPTLLARPRYSRMQASTKRPPVSAAAGEKHLAAPQLTASVVALDKDENVVSSSSSSSSHSASMSPEHARDLLSRSFNAPDHANGFRVPVDTVFAAERSPPARSESRDSPRQELDISDIPLFQTQRSAPHEASVVNDAPSSALPSQEGGPLQWIDLSVLQLRSPLASAGITVAHSTTSSPLQRPSDAPLPESDSDSSSTTTSSNSAESMRENAAAVDALIDALELSRTQASAIASSAARGEQSARHMRWMNVSADAIDTDASALSASASDGAVSDGSSGGSISTAVLRHERALLTVRRTNALTATSTALAGLGESRSIAQPPRTSGESLI